MNTLLKIKKNIHKYYLFIYIYIMQKQLFNKRIGSRAQVMHGNALMTGGGLRKKDLKYNKQGKIVSKKKSSIAKKEKRLQKAGWTTKKGQFGAVRFMIGGGISYYDDLKTVFQINDSILLSDDDIGLYDRYMKIDKTNNSSNIGSKIKNKNQNIEFIKFNAKVLNFIKEQYRNPSNVFDKLTGTYLFLGIYTIFRLDKETVDFLYELSNIESNSNKLQELFKAYHNKFQDTTLDKVLDDTLRNAENAAKQHGKEYLTFQSDSQLETIILSIVEITCSVILPAFIVDSAIKALKGLVSTAYKHIFKSKILKREQYKELKITFQSIGIITGYYSKYTTKLTVTAESDEDEEVVGGKFPSFRLPRVTGPKKKISDAFILFIDLFKKIYVEIPDIPAGEDEQEEQEDEQEDGEGEGEQEDERRFVLNVTSQHGEEV